jgi:hypothetical protein
MNTMPSFASVSEKFAFSLRNPYLENASQEEISQLPRCIPWVHGLGLKLDRGKRRVE